MQLAIDHTPTLPEGFVDEWRKLDAARGRSTPFAVVSVYRSARGFWTIVIGVGKKRQRHRCAIDRVDAIDAARHLHTVVHG